MHVAAGELVGPEGKTCGVSRYIGGNANGDNSLIVLQICDEAADGGHRGRREPKKNQKTSSGSSGRVRRRDWRS